MSPPQAPGPYSQHLLAAASGSQRDALQHMTDLEALLHQHLTAGQAAWPGVTLAPEPFLAHLARLLGAQEEPVEALRQLHAADVYLACACARGDSQALLAFDQQILQKLPSRLGQRGSVTVDEMLQVLRQRLLLSLGGAPPKIADYSGRGALRGWVRMVAARILGELASQEGRQRVAADSPAALERLWAPDNPEHEMLRADSRQALSEAIQVSLSALTERERTLLRMHHLHGFTMDRLATMYGEPRSSVARHVAQARERLLKLTRQELAVRLKLEGREVESLLGVLQSRLDLSLHRLMD